jgi:glycosyltransferase involved in cell wall biosynthesis
MLRVVHVTESIAASAGGTSTAFVELVESLLTQPDRVSVRALTTHLPASDEAANWIAHHSAGTWAFAPGAGRFKGGALAAAATAMMDAGEVDVVHLHGLWLADLVDIARAARRRGIPVVWQPHGMLVQAALARSRMKKTAFRMMTGAGRALRSSAAAVFTSETERDTSRLSWLGSRTRREVVPLPVPVAMRDDQLAAVRRAGRKRWLADDEADPGRTLVNGSPQPDLNTPLLVFMGRLHPVKRLELAIPALALVRRHSPTARLLLIGDGDPVYAQGLRDLARSHGVEDALVFAGWLNGPDKWQALAAGDTLLIQSEFENFGYAIVEALVAGTPVVATDNLSLAAAVAEVGAGQTACATPEGIAAAISELLARGDRQEMGLRGRRWVEANFSREAVGSQLVDLYARVVAAKMKTA